MGYIVRTHFQKKKEEGRVKEGGKKEKGKGKERKRKEKYK
jgi:hypothetical protein